jgi:hypothetical protein
MDEFINIQVRQFEVFVVNDVSTWSQRYILQPLRLKLEVERRFVKDTLQLSTINLVVDNVDARISTVDIILAQLILSRRALIEAPVVRKSKTSHEIRRESSPQRASLRSGDSASASYDESMPATRREALSCTVCVSSVRFVTVNDFDGQNIPIVRMVVDESRFVMNGSAGSGHGEGSLDMTVDFYNSSLNEWEPLLERWNPTLSIRIDDDSTIFEILSVIASLVLFSPSKPVRIC